MCTAISERQSRHLFGRSLDLECSYGERVIIAPRAFHFRFLHLDAQNCHALMAGVGCVRNNTPLYYDAANEYGVCIAGLNFPDRAVYNEYRDGMYNIASFEIIPWLLSQCKNLSEVKLLLKKTNITNDSFSEDMPATPLHWLVADGLGAITVEQTASGLEIYENSPGVLTNSPEFPYHMANLSNFMQISAEPPKNTLCPSVHLSHYSRGMGAFGLPGDYSSASRFVRAVFAKFHTSKEDSNKEVSRFFHIMDTVATPRGTVLTSENRPVMTVYTSCVDTDNKLYYFTTYSSRRIHVVSYAGISPEKCSLVCYKMDSGEDILYL